jgi:hypothetical protein
MSIMANYVNNPVGPASLRPPNAITREHFYCGMTRNHGSVLIVR